MGFLNKLGNIGSKTGRVTPGAKLSEETTEEVMERLLKKEGAWTQAESELYLTLKVKRVGTIEEEAGWG